MSFSLEKLFVDVFAPQKDEIVMIMYDLPNDDFYDTQEWTERRQMAEEWHQEIAQFSWNYGLQINPIINYNATGIHNSDLPEYGYVKGKESSLTTYSETRLSLSLCPSFQPLHR